MNRAESSVFVERGIHTATYDPPAPTGRRFPDVPMDARYAKWVHAAYDAGLIEPCATTPEVRLRPDDPLTRAIAAHMMVRAKDLAFPKEGQTSADDESLASATSAVGD